MNRPSNHKITTVIFDFDGTVADSIAAFIKAGEELLNVEKPLTQAEIDHLRTLSPRQIMKKYSIRAWQVPKMVIDGRRLVAKNVDIITVFPRMSELLHDLKSEGYSIFIVSTNTEATIQKVLRRYRLLDLVTAVYAGASFAGKAAQIKKLTRKHGLDPGECVYVGDEIRDIEAARKARVHGISVSWGYQSKSVLLEKKPEVLIEKPSQFMTALRQLQ